MLHGEILHISLRIQSECGKIRTRKYSVFGHFSRSATFGTGTQNVRRVDSPSSAYSAFLEINPNKFLYVNKA